MSSQLQVSGEAKIRAIQGPVVANSGVITALDGEASQYVRGDGTLADFPTSTGGGSSVSYYLNSSVSQGTIGGVAYRQLGKTPISGAGTDIAISTTGYVASYLTDANDPALLEVPAGNFNCEFYFSVNNNTGNPFVYAEVYKYDGTTFTLLGTSVGVPEYITEGTVINPYYFAVPVATSVLTVTDRIAIRIYVNVDGRTVTLHTENNHLCQVVTTFSKGLISLNNLTRQNQFFGTGTSGTDFAIVSSVATHTFNLPVASAANTGKLSSTDWSTFNGKYNLPSLTSGSVLFSNGTTIAQNNANFFWDNTNSFLGVGTNVPSAGVTSFSATAATQFKAAGTAPAITFSNTLTSASLGCVFGLATSNNQFITGTAAGDMAIANQSTSAGAIVFGTGTTEKMRMTSAGTFSIGNTNSTYKLDVTGIVRFTGELTGSSAVFSSTVRPASSFTSDLGTSSFRWNDIYGFSLTLTSSVTALSIIKSGGTSSQFLKADGSIDSNTYLTTGTAASTYVPYTGATANVNLGAYSLTANQVVVGGAGVNNAGTFTTYDGGVATLLIGSTGNLKFFPLWNPSIGARINAEDSAGSAYIPLSFYASNFYFHSNVNFNSTIGNGTFTYTLPSATGTLALTSNLSAYLPLAGGTLTGALSGTSATFSGTLFANTQFNNTLLAGTDATNITNGFNLLGTQSYWGIRTATGGDIKLDVYGGGAIKTALSIANTTGAATFSSSVSANNHVVSGGNNLRVLTTTNATTGFQYADFLNTSGRIVWGINGSAANGLATNSLAYGGVIYSNNSLQLGVDGDIKVIITSGGNVGIGTGSPNLSGATIGLSLNSSNYSVFEINQNNSRVFNIYANSGETYISNVTASPMIFRTTDTERMRITSGGNVGINTSSPSGKLEVSGSNSSGAGNVYIGNSAALNMLYVSAPNFTMGVNAANGGSVENVRFYNAGTTVGTISTTGSLTSYNVTSDYRLKEDFKDYNALSLISKIKTYDYQWKSDKTRMYGVIAHEVQEILPYIVFGEKDAENMQSVDYSKLTPILLKAIQEQQAQIESQDAKIEELKALIAAK